MAHGYVYFLMDMNHDYFKIGHTAYLMRRIEEIKVPIDFSASFYVSCNESYRADIEKCLHEMFKSARDWHNNQSEWFAVKAIDDAYDAAELLQDYWPCTSKPTAIPKFTCLADLGAALAEATGSTDCHHRLGRIALDIGDRTFKQLADKVEALMARNQKLDPTCPYDAEHAAMNEADAERLLTLIEFEPFMTGRLRTMARLFPTLKRRPYDWKPDADQFADVE